MRVNKDLFLVSIDKEAQNQKRSKAGSLYIPENYKDMVYNLQYGPVVQIGENAGKEFPEVELDDILIFHHHVEYKPRTDGDEMYTDDHLIEVMENGDEIRTVNTTHEVLGVIKTIDEDTVIIPFKNTVFCHEHFKPASFQQSSSGLYLPDEWEQSVEQMTAQLEELKQQQDALRNSIEWKQDRRFNYKKVEEIEKAINTILKERETLSRKMNEEKYMELTMLYVNPATAKIWGVDAKAGDTIFGHSFALYPLDIQGIHFTLINSNYIALIKTRNMTTYEPLHDRVLVTPDEKETKTAGGIIVPDTVQHRPNSGTVIAVGPGRKDEPTSLKENDHVLFGKNAGTKIEVEGEDYLLMREGDIFMRKRSA